MRRPRRRLDADRTQEPVLTAPPGSGGRSAQALPAASPGSAPIPTPLATQEDAPGAPPGESMSLRSRLCSGPSPRAAETWAVLRLAARAAPLRARHARSGWRLHCAWLRAALALGSGRPEYGRYARRAGLPFGGRVSSRYPVLAVSASSLSGLLASAPVVGVSGSRAPSPASASVCRWAVRQLAPSASVVVGCATGIDAVARALRPSASVVQAAAFGFGPGALAARSTAVVRAVGGGGPSALWLAFPSGPCPAGLVPSRRSSACFSGSGSGTWASLALAVGLGIPALALLPPGVAVPAGWPLAPVSGCAGPRGSWVRFRPSVIQSALAL